MADTTKPGVQNPHWRPWWSRKACCTGLELAVGSAEAFDGGHFGAVGLHGEDEAGAHGLAVEQDRARAADAVLAPEVGAGELASLAQEVRQRQSRLDRSPTRVTVDPHLDRVVTHRAHLPSPVARPGPPSPRRPDAGSRPSRGRRRARCLKPSGRRTLTLQEMENIIFEGSEAAVARVNLEAAPSEETLARLRAENADIIELNLIEL